MRLRAKLIMTNFDCINSDYEQKKNWSFWDRKKSTWQDSSLMDLPYVHWKLKQTLAPCCPQIARVCFSFLWTCWRLNKLETCPVGKLVQHHQNILNPWTEQLKLGILLKAYFQTKRSCLSQMPQLCIFQRFSIDNVQITKKKS